MLHESLHDRIERRLRRRRLLSLHAGLTILVTLATVWAVEVFNLPSKTQDIVIPAAVLLLIAHALWSRYQEAGYAIAQQEIQRERQYEMTEKPKHHLTIGDDGELSEIIYDEDDLNEKAKHGE